MRFSSFAIFIIAFVLGVALASGVGLSYTIALLFVVIALALFLLPRLHTSVSIHSALVPLALVAVALGVIRYDVAQWLNTPSDKLVALVGEEVTLTGVVIDEPDERDDHVKLTVQIETSDTVSDTDKILLNAPHFPRITYGDRIEFAGVLKQPEAFESEDTGRTFDYEMYLAKSGVHFLMYYPQLSVAEHDQGSRVKATLFNIKETFLSSVNTVIHEPYAALLGGLVVGSKRSLGEDLLDAFRVTGLIHIVVLSGYNVTIVAESLMRFFSFLPRLWTLLLGGGSIVLFAIMTGASATIVRASIMALLVVIGRYLGRASDLPRLLLVALFLMVFHNPYIVLYDPSFQLSFVAMLGLIYFAPLLEMYMWKVTPRFGLRSIAAATIATQIAVLPLLLYMMGEISLVALPVNLLVLIFIPLTMLLGFLTGVAGLVSRVVALPLAFLTFLLLYYEIQVVNLFSHIPFASIAVKHFPLMAVAITYLLYTYMYTRVVKHAQNKQGREIVRTTSYSGESIDSTSSRTS